MIKCWVLFIFLTNIYADYCDEELEALWYSIADIHHPTIQDYLFIDEYLAEGERPYLNRLQEIGCISDKVRWDRIHSFRLLGSHRETPLFEKHTMGENPVPGRCVLLFASYNHTYPAKAREALANLKACGYQGDVLLRIGGFPNVEHGGLKLCHVPYSFKAAFLKEAELLGYQHVLWMDTAIHPMTDMNEIFSHLDERGTFFNYVCTLKENLPGDLISAAGELGVTLALYDRIYHLHTGLIGLNFQNERARCLLNEWLQACADVWPCMTWFPEELSFSIIAWRLRCRPVMQWENLVCYEEELGDLSYRPDIAFYMDRKR